MISVKLEDFEKPVKLVFYDVNYKAYLFTAGSPITKDAACEVVSKGLAMMIPSFVRTFLFVCLYIPALAACSSSQEVDVTDFQASDVSCSIRSLPETADALKALGRNWYNNNNEADVNAIASRVMDFANQGDPEAMMAWGIIKQHALIKKQIKNEEDRLNVRFYPDEARADMTRAIAYALIVLSAGGEHKAMSRPALRALEHSMEPVLTVPTEWIREAEAVAFQWGSQCQLPMPSFTRDVAPFTPDKLACKSREISEARIKMEAIKNHPASDLYFIRHADEIFDDLRNYANAGDPEAMYYIGSLKYEAILISQIHNFAARRISRPFPEYTKPDLITAMTYIFASQEMKGKHQESVQEVIQRIESRSKSDVFVPTSWIVEAKANVNQWRELCISK